MRDDETMNGDTIEIFFTVEPIVDAVLNTADLSPPIIKFLTFSVAKMCRMNYSLN